MHRSTRRLLSPWAALFAALLVASPVSAQTGGDTGFDGVRFGDTSAALLQRYGTRATRLARPLDFGDTYVDVVLRRHMLGGYPFIVFFQMDKATRILKRIQIERPRHGAVAMVHQAVVADLEARYGKPADVCIDRVARPGGQAIDERVWRTGTIMIRIVFREQSLGVLAPRKLDVYDWETWEPSPEGMPQQLFVRITPADAGGDACSRGP
jgi:hypothetical protein